MSTASANGNFTLGDTLCMGPANERRYFQESMLWRIFLELTVDPAYNKCPALFDLVKPCMYHPPNYKYKSGLNSNNDGLCILMIPDLTQFSILWLQHSHAV